MEGVRLAGGREDDEILVGGVLDLEGSLIVVEWVDAKSGDKLGGVGCGMVVSNNSDRRRVEKVRLASSAAERLIVKVVLGSRDTVEGYSLFWKWSSP